MASAVIEPGLLEALSADRNLAIETIFGDSHEDDTAPFHVDVVNLWSSADEFVMIEGFRESGKTTRALEFLTLEALFGNYRFGLFIADNFAKACDKLDIMRWHLRDNAKIRAIFGDTIGEKDNASILQLKNGVKLQAMGREQSPRGLLYRTARPDRIYIDDPENRERGDVASTQAVDNTMKWLYGDVIPAMDKRNGKIRINATPMARDCMVSRLRDDPSWVTRRYPIVMGDVDSEHARAMWPARYPVNWVRARRDMARSQGLLTAFMQEYMCVSEEESEKVFPAGGFVETPAATLEWEPMFAVLDPARTTKKTSNLTGMAVFSLVGSKIRVHESSGERLQPSQIVSRLFELQEKYCPVAIGIESNSLEEFLMQPIRQEMIRRHVILPIVELRAPHDQRKADFIKGLQPFYNAGDIELIGGDSAHSRLVEEMTSFPSKNDDVVNALAYATRIRPGQPVYDDFGVENVVPDTSALRAQPIYVAFNASGKEVTCVAMQLQGQAMMILDDWMESGDVFEAVASIRRQIQAQFSNHRVLAFCPSDHFDDWARTALVQAMKANKIPPARGAPIQDSRGALSHFIRTTWKGQRCLLVPRHARHTLNALACGYCLPLGNDGRLGSTPADNQHRTLSEGVESLTQSIDSGINAPIIANYAVGSGGQRYMTSRPGIALRPR